MPRLFIDARLAGHSGIGVYVAEMLPRVLPLLAAWRPVVLAGERVCNTVATLAGAHAETAAWDVPPLSLADLVATPPGVAHEDLLWTPHFNVPLRAGMPLFVTLHDLLPLTAPALAGRGRSVPLRAWMRAIRRRARAVMCVSEFTRKEAVRVGGLDPGRLRVAHLGADAAWFDARRATSAPPTAVFVGLMKPHKNVLRLLRAFASVRDRIPHRLVLVGRRRGVRNVDRAAVALAATLPDRVQLVEDVPFAELLRIVSAADFAVQPSLHEGFGLPALEAMAAGVPVLASRAGALPEVCGDAALYCDPASEEDIAQGLLRLAGDAALRATLAAAGRERARAFSWDACAEATVIALAGALEA